MLPFFPDCPFVVAPTVLSDDYLQSALFHYIQLPSNLQQVGLIFLRLVYHIFPVSLYFPILIAPAVFSNLLIRHLFIEVPSQESELTCKYERFM